MDLDKKKREKKSGIFRGLVSMGVRHLAETLAEVCALLGSIPVSICSGPGVLS